MKNWKERNCKRNMMKVLDMLMMLLNIRRGKITKSLIWSSL